MGIWVKNIKVYNYYLIVAKFNTICISETLVEHEIDKMLIVDYLLFQLNKRRNFSYVEFLNLDQPYDNLNHLMARAAVNNGWVRDKYDEFGTNIYVILKFKFNFLC